MGQELNSETIILQDWKRAREDLNVEVNESVDEFSDQYLCSRLRAIIIGEAQLSLAYIETVDVSTSYSSNQYRRNLARTADAHFFVSGFHKDAASDPLLFLDEGRVRKGGTTNYREKHLGQAASLYLHAAQVFHYTKQSVDEKNDMQPDHVSRPFDFLEHIANEIKLFGDILARVYSEWRLSPLNMDLLLDD